MKCCICGNEIEVTPQWSKGHNAEPVKSGRCCSHCNYSVVLPVRICGMVGNEGRPGNERLIADLCEKVKEIENH